MNLSAAVEALGAACDDAVADIAKQVADMSQTDCDTAIAYALGGGRGYGGDIYGGRAVADQRSDDARSVLMESARSLGILGAKAVALSETVLCVRIVGLLAPLLSEEDRGAMLASRYSGTDLVCSNAACVTDQFIWQCCTELFFRLTVLHAHGLTGWQC